MAYVSLDELKTALGVGDLYPDATLHSVIDTATAVIKPFLDTQSVGITYARVDSGTVLFSTIQRHGFAIGQSVIVTDTDYNATYTVTSKTDFTFSAATASADKPAYAYRPMGTATLSTATTYDTVDAVRQATLMIAVDVFNARTTPGGQAQGIDFTPGPYMMGRSIISKVMGLIGRYRDVGSMIG
jgi:hypothetical protein